MITANINSNTNRYTKKTDSRRDVRQHDISIYKSRSWKPDANNRNGLFWVVWGTRTSAVITTDDDNTQRWWHKHTKYRDTHTLGERLRRWEHKLVDVSDENRGVYRITLYSMCKPFCLVGGGALFSGDC